MARPPQRRSASSSSGGAFGGGLGAAFGGAGRMPPIVVVLMVTTIVLSIVAAVGLRNGFPLAEWAALIPQRVLRGEAWRLFTWVFFEISHPVNLLFACVCLYVFGSDLALRWGPTRFIVNYLGLATVVGATVVAIGRIYPPLAAGALLGSWPVQLAFIIFWASFFPTKQLRYFVPLGGRTLILVTLGGTLLYALYAGIEQFTAHFIAEGIALAVVRLPSPRMWWLERKLRGMEKRRRSGHLKAVPRDSADRNADSDDKPDPPDGRWLN